jgi:hypothetical protein
MDSKFWGAYRVARAAKVVDGGSIAFVSGFLAHRPSATAVLQGAINAAIEALGRGLVRKRVETSRSSSAAGTSASGRNFGFAALVRNRRSGRIARLPGSPAEGPESAL